MAKKDSNIVTKIRKKVTDKTDKTDVVGPVITIDFRYWCTQQQRAGDDRREFATLRQHVKRLKHGEKSPLTEDDIKDVIQLGITLVRRKR